MKKSQAEGQLIIVGGGGAGFAAAIEAAERGVEGIIVVEKRQNTGGNTALAGGMFACESPVQAREKMLADKDLMFKKAMNWARWSRVDPEIIRAFINKSGETIEWLERKGLEFKLVKLYPDQNPLVQHNPIGGGAKLIQTLRREANDKGVQIMTKTRATRLCLDDVGVCSVSVADNTGSYDIKANQVILATGGFAGNRELLQKMCSQYYDEMPLSGLPLTGDGISLARDVGAMTEDFATMIKEGPRFDLHQWPLMTFERDPSTIWVNKNGRRFVDESTGYRVFEAVNAMLRQPEKISFALLDADIRKLFELKMPGIKAALEAEVSKNRVHVSDSLDDIADWIGATPETLRETVSEYNRFCERGYDETFAKERRYLVPIRSPPYYAIKGLSVLLDTIGGICINKKMEVIGKNLNPIPGLFAAGVVASGWEPEIYCSDLSASAFGFAINSGRIAGENASYNIL